MSMVIGLIVISFSLMTFMFTVFPLLEAQKKYQQTVLETLQTKVELMEVALKLSSVKKLEITSYSPRVQETDSTPLINACGTKVATGQVAVTNDLWHEGWICGRKIWIEGHGIYTVMDRMNSRFVGRLDIFNWSTRRAIRYGLKKRVVILTEM